MKASLKVDITTSITYEREVTLSWSDSLKSLLKWFRLGWLVNALRLFANADKQ